jgi:CheY-like chemotaxis protein
MPGETILVVDDAVFDLKLIATVLRNSYYKVGCGASDPIHPFRATGYQPAPGRAAVCSARDRACSAVEAKWRQQTRLHYVVVIAMTASAREGIEQEALDAGCNGFIAKPVDPKALASADSELSGR